jgi:hypothetical protein
VRPIPGGGVAHAGQDAGRLAAMLRAGAAGWHADQAAAELLLRHGYWPGQGEFVRRFVRAGAGATPAAWVDWQGAVDGLDGGGLAGTGSEGAVLRIAASLGGGLPVSLRAVLGGLDHVNIGLVAEALLRANGTTAATVSVPAPAARPPGVRVAGRGEGRSGRRPHHCPA